MPTWAGMTTEESWKREITDVDPFDPNEECKEDHNIRIATTISHFNDEIKSILESIQPNTVNRIGGAGNKCNCVGRNVVDAYVFPSFGLKYWDICAPSAIYKGMGCFGTNLLEERLVFPIDGDRKLRGLILARNKSMHGVLVKRLAPVIAGIRGKFMA